jgi:hypothetical protein
LDYEREKRAGCIDVFTTVGTSVEPQQCSGGYHHRTEEKWIPDKQHKRGRGRTKTTQKERAGRNYTQDTTQTRDTKARFTHTPHEKLQP